ncbi:TPA: hypothetical protein HA219_02465 [Candidatus Woesearchaeota archaeon]|nr:hypothetical protein [Candidatus Woesearchaeota archaeon]HIH39556.1 hypothetical protein [Candidatus Woesearchaeota archaeon]
MRIIFILLITLVFLTACTRIELGKDKITIKEKSENITESNSTFIKNIENKIQEKIPRLESNLDTPAIVEKRIIDETESVYFGDVI